MMYSLALFSLKILYRVALMLSCLCCEVVKSAMNICFPSFVGVASACLFKGQNIFFFFFSPPFVYYITSYGVTIFCFGFLTNSCLSGLSPVNQGPGFLLLTTYCVVSS